ncbi:hypothetical protein CTAYLR_006051 [Chrysophaeum taylorii]|uniref:RecA family profile 1 domain-containing protein n=1 Tax=Chrysophaeum taylorii TaxID=2483200 RepID=A0AAD7UJD4_9STRA|nr:hypothetical protein CTAYLR_006051 [Chrysophaeum taylorii]
MTLFYDVVEDVGKTVLAAGAIAQIRSSGETYDGELVVQVLEVTQLASKNYRFELWDSRDRCACNVASKLRGVASVVCKFGIVRITHHLVNRVAGQAVVIALGLEVVAASGRDVIDGETPKSDNNNASPPPGREKMIDETPRPPKSPPASERRTMTSEQKKRVEANKQAALEKKRQREASSGRRDAPEPKRLSPRDPPPPLVADRSAPARAMLFPRDEPDEARIDAAVSSCLDRCTITECHGVSSSGKSCFGVTLGALALARYPETHVLFVETNGGAHRLSRRAMNVADDRLGAGEAKRRILVTSAMDLNKLVDVLTRQVAKVVAQRPISFVVVDSVADVLRDANDTVERRQNIVLLLKAIKRCVSITSCACFLINQVVADFGAGASPNAVQASHNSTFAKLAKLRFKLTRPANHNIRNLRYLSHINASPDETGDVPTVPFVITKTGMHPPPHEES